MSTEHRIIAVEFTNFKALQQFSLKLQRMNLLVGPNNCGKSTIIGAFRVLAEGIRRARSKGAERVMGPDGLRLGYRIPEPALPVSVENVHSEYSDKHSRVVFKLSNRNSLELFFPKDGGCALFASSRNRGVQTPSEFKREFPVTVGVVPVLGPLEHEEAIVDRVTVQRNLATHRASRNFRNYWRYNPEGFDAFAKLIRDTWLGMEIGRPEIVSSYSNQLAMYALENRMTRELFWSGFGFQIWCQLLTHITRSVNDSLLIVDEPEIYLHPDIQRQLLGILRDIGPDILLATHSTEIMAEADPTEIILVDKNRKAGERVRDVEGVQLAMNAIGSIQNITLTQLARNRRVLFVEGLSDYGILRRFARKLGLTELSIGAEITAVESGGFSTWTKVHATAWGIERTLGATLNIGAVFDRDYRCEEETNAVIAELKERLQLVHIHERKEIENYLLCPAVLERAFTKALQERQRRSGEAATDVEPIRALLEKLSAPLKDDAQAQYIARRIEHLAHSRKDAASITGDVIRWFELKWSNVESRMEIVPGKSMLAALRTELQSRYSVNLTTARIVDEYQTNEIPDDLVRLLKSIDEYRQRPRPTSTSRPLTDTAN